MSLLELEDVRASYGPVEVLEGVSLSVPDRGAVGILGANGAGKTTTLRAISGTVTTKGSIVFDGKDIRGKRPEQVAALGIAHVPEGRGTLGDLTVMENLMVGAYLRKDRKGIFATAGTEEPRVFRKRHGPCPMPERASAKDQPPR